MAVQTEDHLVDDLQPYYRAKNTIVFGLDGNVFEINLADQNAAALRRRINRYAKHARIVGKIEVPKTGKSKLLDFLK